MSSILGFHRGSGMENKKDRLVGVPYSESPEHWAGLSESPTLIDPGLHHKSRPERAWRKCLDQGSGSPGSS